MEREGGHDNVTFAHFTVHPDSPSFEQAVTPIARCYQQVYGLDRSWNEGRICRSCSRPGVERKWNYRDAPEQCPDCGKATEHRWPLERIIGDMRNELVRPHAVCAVAKRDAEVVGGCWGFSATAEELVEHLNDGFEAPVQVRGVIEALAEQYPSVERFGYYDEIFVHPDHQGKGYGKRLFALRHHGLGQHGIRVCTMRTKSNPPSSTFLWYCKAFDFQIIGRYPDSDERVVMAQWSDRITAALDGQ